MTKLATWLKVLFSEVAFILCYYLGGLDELIYTLFALVTADYITGVVSAIIHKNLNSAVGFKGIAHKVFIFVLVGLANLIETNVLKTNNVLRSLVILYYIANEGISIIENAGEIGLPVPKKLLDVLEQLKRGVEDDSEQRRT